MPTSDWAKMHGLVRWVAIIVAAALGGSLLAQPIPVKNADFEDVDGSGWAKDWQTLQHAGDIAYRFAADTEKPLAGKRSARIEQYAPQAFGAFKQRIDAKAYAGKRVKLTASLRSRDLRSAGGGLYLRVDGVSDTILGNDFSSGRTGGTHDWKPFKIVMDIPVNAHALEYGVMLQDLGTVWADRFALSITDEPITAKPITDTPDTLTFDNLRPRADEERLPRRRKGTP